MINFAFTKSKASYVILKSKKMAIETALQVCSLVKECTRGISAVVKFSLEVYRCHLESKAGRSMCQSEFSDSSSYNSQLSSASKSRESLRPCVEISLSSEPQNEGDPGYHKPTIQL